MRRFRRAQPRYNLTMLRARCLLALVASLATAPAQDLPAYDLPVDIAAQVRGLTKGEPLQLLASLGGMDLELRAAAEEHWQVLDARAQCALVRAGLRAADPDVAIGAAAKADAGVWLDPREQKRAAAVGMARCNVFDTPFDVGKFFKMLDARDTAQLLANPGELPREVPEFFGMLHHRFGPEHQAQVELLTRSDDVLVRQDAAKYFAVVRLERARYAHFLLSQPLAEQELPAGFEPMRDKRPFVPRKFTLREPGDGYSPLLAAVLERVFLAGAESGQGDRVFAWRWARESKASPIDRPLLARLLRSETDEVRRIGILGLRQVGGDDRNALLAELAAKADGEALAPQLALADLARDGDPAARTRLAEIAQQKPLALALLWQCDRDAALVTVATAVGADVAAGLLAWQRLGQAAEDGEFWGEPMAGLDDVLRERCAAAELDGARLAFVLDKCPAVRTKALCARAIEALAADNIAAMPLGVLELVDAPALAQALHRVLVTPNLMYEPRYQALRGLARLGGPALGDAAQAEHVWQQTALEQNDENRATLRIGLAASGNAVIAARVREVGKDERWHPGWDTAGIVGALAAAGGIDRRLAYAFASDLHERGGDELAALREELLPRLLAGDGPGAILHFLLLRDPGDGRFDFLCKMPGSASLAYLRRCRAEREHGLYCWATGELARAGDAEARAEVESAIAARLYGWIDSFSDDVLTDGKSLDRVPLLLRQVDSNCCTFAVIASALEDMFECDTFVSEHGLRSRPEIVRDAWQRSRGQLAFSRIADRWLIAPK